VIVLTGLGLGAALVGAQSLASGPIEQGFVAPVAGSVGTAPSAPAVVGGSSLFPRPSTSPPRTRFATKVTRTPTSLATSSTSSTSSTTPTSRPGTSPSRRPGSATTRTPEATCTYRYTFSSVWTGGFVASITLWNTTSRTLQGWDGGFGLAPAATVNQSWGATMRQTGSWVVLTPPAEDNGTIKPGAKLSIGFRASATSEVRALGGFALNGRPCAPA
jgi:hypothetical protein